MGIHSLKKNLLPLLPSSILKPLLKRRVANKLITLRSDRRDKYTSNLFQEYCREQGIKMQFTTSYASQQNDIAERKNRIIFDMTRTMLKEKGLPKQLWAETVVCSTCSVGARRSK